MLGRRSLSRHGRQESMNRRGSISTPNLSISLTLMNYKTVKEIRTELEHRGGRLEKVLDNQMPEYVPHLATDHDPQGWEHGIWERLELLDWANKTDLGNQRVSPWYAPK